MFKEISVAALISATAAQAGDQYWEYQDWTVHVQTVDTGQDVRVTCRASTGGDGDPILFLTQSNGDAGPPYHYPQPTLLENAPRGYSTLMREGARVLFQFDVDWYTEGFALAGFTQEGIMQAVAQAHPGDSLGLLQTMRRAGTLWVTMDGEVVYAASLSGFTAAYGKMAEQCGFPSVGVID
ncbi:MAG: hypothetical protein ABJ360_21430 [Roseobacter sp.]